MRRIRVTVIGGGKSSERAVSLRSSKEVAAALPRTKYVVRRLNYSGRVEQLRGLKGTTDVAFLALHGKYGEDGMVQQALEKLGIPYTGSGVRASALGMNKARTQRLVAARGVQTPQHALLHSVPGSTAPILRRIGLPCVVKPNASGSSVGISIVKTEPQLLPAIRKAFREDSSVLVEQFIGGRELTCGVIGNSGQTTLRALPLVEIIPLASTFFDYRAKYRAGGAKEICPAPVGPKVRAQVQATARRVHTLLGCDGVSRSDFILSSSGTLYFLEVNTIPGFTNGSLVPKEASAAGIPFPEFCSRLIQLALRKRSRD